MHEIEETVREPVKFSIKENAHAIHVLSSSLYSKPVVAIVRELVCNAYDSHLAAGQTRPVEVTYSSGFLRVQDYGLGLSPADLEALFGTYFESSKKASDPNSIGSFGLGSKSPFAYTKSFDIITSWYGAKYQYQASIDPDTLMPVLTLVHTTNAGVELLNGVEVIVPHNNDHDFYEACYSVLPWFGDSVVMSDGGSFRTVTKAMPTFEMGKFAMYDTYGAKAEVLYKNVVYALDMSNIPSDHSARKYLNGISFVLTITDEISIAPSREHLHYNAKTIQALSAALNTVVTDLLTYKQALLDKDIRTLRKEYADLRQGFPAALFPAEFTDEKTGAPVMASGAYYLGGSYFTSYEYGKKGRDYFHSGYETMEKGEYPIVVGPMSKVKKEIILERNPSTSSRFFHFPSEEMFSQALKVLFMEEDEVKSEVIRTSKIKVDKKSDVRDKLVMKKVIGGKYPTRDLVNMEEVTNCLEPVLLSAVYSKVLVNYNLLSLKAIAPRLMDIKKVIPEVEFFTVPNAQTEKFTDKYDFYDIKEIAQRAVDILTVKLANEKVAVRYIPISVTMRNFLTAVADKLYSIPAASYIHQSLDRVPKEFSDTKDLVDSRARIMDLFNISLHETDEPEPPTFDLLEDLKLKYPLAELIFDRVHYYSSNNEKLTLMLVEYITLIENSRWRPKSVE